MAKPKQITKKDLIHAARQQLLNKGQGKVTLKNVAEAAGVTQGVVYYHFKTKEQLLISLFKDYYNQIEEQEIVLKQGKKFNLKEWLSEEMYQAQISSEGHRLHYELAALSLHHREMKHVMGEVVNGRVRQCTELMNGDHVKGRLLAAVTDGLALQSIFDPSFKEKESYDLAKKWLEKLLLETE